MSERYSVQLTARQRIATFCAALTLSAGVTACYAENVAPSEDVSIPENAEVVKVSTEDALRSLGSLAVKGRAPKTGYSRDQFGDGWLVADKCDTRDTVLKRDLTETVVDSECKVLSGILQDPYTGETVHFKKGRDTSNDVQIDHVVALSDAWQKGAQQMSTEDREAFANDELNLLAVKGKANQQKGDGDAASWLPKNKGFRCEYVARQVLVKDRYDLWVTQAEHDQIDRVLNSCPGREFSMQQ